MSTSSNKSSSSLKSCPFLTLPLELRVQVYEYTLVSDAKCLRHPVELNNHYKRNWTERRRGVSCRSKTVIKRTPWAMLRLNRQIHQEAIHTFYSRNHFQFNITHFDGGFNDCRTSVEPAKARLLDRQNMRFIRSISLKDPWGSPFHRPSDMSDGTFAWYINKLRETCPMLLRLAIHMLPRKYFGRSTLRSTTPYVETQVALRRLMPQLESFHLLCFDQPALCNKLQMMIYPYPLSTIVNHAGARIEWPYAHIDPKARKAMETTRRRVMRLRILDELDPTIEIPGLFRYVFRGGQWTDNAKGGDPSTRPNDNFM